jgi:hypothetical protein
VNIEKDLTALNAKIAEMEQAGGLEAIAFFEALLSDQLVFRRASGKVVGKSGPEGFLEGLKKASPFSSRRPENISVTHLDDRALVTLIVVGTRADDGSAHRYRNIRLFSCSGDNWVLDLWYNYEVAGA